MSWHIGVVKSGQRILNLTVVPVYPVLDEALRTQVASFSDAKEAEHTQRWNATQDMLLSASTVGRAIRVSI